MVVLLFSLRGLAGFYTDYLWFDSVGQRRHLAAALAATIAPSLVSRRLLRADAGQPLIADRLAPQYRPMGPEDELVERYQRVRRARTRAGSASPSPPSSRWSPAPARRRSGSEWILFTNAVDFGIEDPQFDSDIGFYVFQLPFLRSSPTGCSPALVIVLHRHGRRPLPERRHPLPEPVPAGDPPGEGAPLGDPRA